MYYRHAVCLGAFNIHLAEPAVLLGGQRAARIPNRDVHSLLFRFECRFRFTGWQVLMSCPMGQK